MKCINKVRICEYSECPEGKAVCCADCLLQDTCKHPECCWENPLKCGSCREVRKEK